MKRTELERKERDLRKAEKKMANLGKSKDKSDKSVSDYIDELFSLFLYGPDEIYNAKTEIKILELLEEIKENLPEKQWENVLKKAIKKTKTEAKDKAFNELMELLGS